MVITFAADSVAGVDDVKEEINTNLDSGEIEAKIEDATFRLSQETDLDSISDDLQTRLEKKMAAIAILQTKEREPESHERESASRSYDVSTIESLKEEVRHLDPTDTLYRAEKENIAFGEAL